MMLRSTSKNNTKKFQLRLKLECFIKYIYIYYINKGIHNINMKKTMKLSDTELKKLITESVKNIGNYIGFDPDMTC